MAKEQILHDENGNEIYPITGSEQVFRNGAATTVEDSLKKLEEKETGISDAPKDGKTYGRNNGAWKEVTGGGASDAVLYTPQTLTEGQKEQARKNILALGQQDSTVYDIVHLAWATDAATTRKLIPAGNRKKGVKISYRNASGVYIVEQYQSEDVSDTAWGTDSNWKGCRTPLTPLFEGVEGVYFNDETGYYEVYKDEGGLIDVTEEEMALSFSTYSGFGVIDTRTLFSLSDVRFNIKIKCVGPAAASMTSCFSQCSKLEAAFFRLSQPPSNLTSTFYNCVNLRKIIGRIYLSGASNYNTIFFGCAKLEEFTLAKLTKNISFSDSPLINYVSTKYLIDNAANTEAITITVHPTTYGYLTGTIEPTPEVGGTKAEWMALVETAQGKQISFGTTE